MSLTPPCGRRSTAPVRASVGTHGWRGRRRSATGASAPAESRSLSRRFCQQAKRRDPRELFHAPTSAGWRASAGHASPPPFPSRKSTPGRSPRAPSWWAITDAIHHGADMVVNLAVGLDTRPNRLALPSGLPWIDVDLPGILDYKESTLKGVAPVCALERERVDLSDAGARRAVLERVGTRGRRGVVVAEGLLIYLETEAVTGLARDLAEAKGFERWTFDMASPGLLRLMQRRMGRALPAQGCRPPASPAVEHAAVRAVSGDPSRCPPPPALVGGVRPGARLRNPFLALPTEKGVCPGFSLLPVTPCHGGPFSGGGLDGPAQPLGAALRAKRQAVLYLAGLSSLPRGVRHALQWPDCGGCWSPQGGRLPAVSGGGS